MQQRNRPGGDFPGAVAFPWRGRWPEGPDEVEGHRFVTAHGDSRSLRPHQSQLTLRQLLLQEKPFLRSTGPVAQSQWLPLHRGTYVSPVSAYGIRCGRGMPPPLHAGTILRPAPHPSALTGSHLPPGEGESQSGQAPTSSFARSPNETTLPNASAPGRGSSFSSFTAGISG